MGTRLIRYCGVDSVQGARPNGLEMVWRCLRSVRRESAWASSVYEGKAGSSDLRYFCCENKALAAVHGSPSEYNSQGKHSHDVPRESQFSSGRVWNVGHSESF